MENGGTFWQCHLSPLLRLVGLCQLLQRRLLQPILAPIILHRDRACIYRSCLALSQWQKLCHSKKNPCHHGVRIANMEQALRMSIEQLYFKCESSMFQSGHSAHLGKWMGPICWECAEKRGRTSSSHERHWIHGSRHPAFGAAMAGAEYHWKKEETSTISPHFFTRLCHLCFNSWSFVDFLLPDIVNW